MAEFLQIIGMLSIVAGIIAVAHYRENTYLPRRKAKATGKDVTVFNASGGRVFRPDGTDYSFRFF